MDKLNKFLSEAHLFKVFLFGWICSTIIGFGMFLLMSFMDSFIDVEKSFLMALVIGLLMGFLTMLFMSSARKSDIFWSHAEKVEELIDSVETLTELEDIIDGDIKELRRLSQGGPHYEKIRFLHGLIKMKSKYVK